MKRLFSVFLALSCGVGCSARQTAPLADINQAHEWDAPDRDAWQLPHAIVQALEIKPGQKVVDLGSGTGYMLPFLAEAAGPDGKVYALEVQKDFATMLRFRVHHEQLNNVEVIEDTPTTLNLPEKVDRVLLVNTYRQLEHPIVVLKAIRAALKPGGLIVIVDVRPDPRVEGPPPEQRLHPSTVEAEARGAGLAVIADSEHLPRDYLLVLTDADEAAKLPGSQTPTHP